MARDPNEQETSLESIYTGNNEAFQWYFESYAPGDGPPSAEFGEYPPPDGYTLPDAYGIPYPQLSIDGSSAPTSWPLTVADFTESPSKSYDVPGNGGVQGVYLQQLGVCAYDIPIQATIIDQLTTSIPPALASAINGSALSYLGPSAANLTAATAFLNRTNDTDIFSRCTLRCLPRRTRKTRGRHPEQRP